MTNSQDMLNYNFEGIDGLNDVIKEVLKKLSLSDSAASHAANVKKGVLTLEEFDGWLFELVQSEVSEALDKMRELAVSKAVLAGAGSAAYAVLRRLYAERLGGNINIATNRKRISSRKRVVPPPSGGRSGVRRVRTVSEKTTRTREYYGPDRGFILRFIDGGTDVRTASPAGQTGRGSKATYGRRGNIEPRNFFSPLKVQMDAAVQELGKNITEKVESYINKQL